MHCGHYYCAPLQLFDAVEHRHDSLQQQLATAAAMDLSSIAHACGQLGYCSQLLLGALLQAAADCCRQDAMQTFSTWELANLCWSAAVLDQKQYAPQVLGLAADGLKPGQQQKAY